MLNEQQIRNIKQRYIEELEQIEDQGDRRCHCIAIACLDMVLNE